MRRRLAAFARHVFIGACLAMSLPTCVFLAGWLERVLAARIREGPAFAWPDWLSAGAWRDNLVCGLRSVVTTWLVTGWGTAVMFASYEYGWVHSFHKDYEVNRLGGRLFLFGAAVVLASCLYAPQAFAHRAATGNAGATFEAGSILTRLRNSPRESFAVALAFAGWGVCLEVLKTAAYFLDRYFEDWPTSRLVPVYVMLNLGYCAVLVVALVHTRLLIARAYLRGAKSRRFGTAEAFLMVAALGLWLFFTVTVMFGEFFHYHPVLGYLNRPLLQLPHGNLLPGHLFSGDEP